MLVALGALGALSTRCKDLGRLAHRDALCVEVVKVGDDHRRGHAVHRLTCLLVHAVKLLRVEIRVAQLGAAPVQSLELVGQLLAHLLDDDGQSLDEHDRCHVHGGHVVRLRNVLGGHLPESGTRVHKELRLCTVITDAVLEPSSSLTASSVRRKVDVVLRGNVGIGKALQLSGAILKFGDNHNLGLTHC